ncbi:hypothetical protein SEA_BENITOANTONIO_77 [Arthrobacter phage BenitoAntonio]|nr:hypothetical protein SEA_BENITOANTONIO_77 [Arthrobacter phage BenitoAntonio]
MTHFRNAFIRKQINLLERRKAHLESVDRGSFDRAEASALATAIEAMEEKYPERPEASNADMIKFCGTMQTHEKHEYEIHPNAKPLYCGGFLRFEG